MDASELHDISVAFDPATPAWPGDTPFSCGWAWAMADGASVNVSRIETSPHVGTHADAPLHVLADGAGADALPLSAFVGPALVIDVADRRGILTHDDLHAAGYRPGVVRLILRTGATTARGSFPETWPALDAATARQVVAEGLRLLAVDCPSVDQRESKDLAVHHALFAHGAFVLENLDLEAVTPGPYDLIALPLKMADCDAAPVRAFLRAG